MTVEANRSHVRDAARELDIAAILFRRWGATMIDLIVFAVVFVGLILILPEPFAIVTLSFCPLVLAAYYAVAEGQWGQTLGKRLVGVIVVDQHGKPPGIPKALVRTVMRLIEVDPFLLGAIPAAIAVMASQHRQRLGDMLADTYVLPVKVLAAAGPDTVFA